MLPLLAFTFLIISSPVFAATEAGNKTGSVDGLSPKAIEMISLYESSIKYWDTPSLEIQKEILKQLVEDQQVKVPGCPRIRYPMVCDNDGVILENVCYFKMRRRERQGLLPVLVFTVTPIDEARAMCDKEVKKP